MKKKYLAIILAIVCVLGMSAFASAGNSPFDITMAAYEDEQPDPISMREIKDDNEQTYYVRCTSMSHPKGYFRFQSCSIKGGIVSPIGTCSALFDLNQTRAFSYGTYAPGGQEYYLKGFTVLFEACPYNELNIKGIYCP